MGNENKAVGGNKVDRKLSVRMSTTGTGIVNFFSAKLPRKANHAELLQKKLKSFHVEGLVAAVFTPFKDTFEVDIQKIEDYSRFLHLNAVKNVFVNGTTGEGTSLTISERKQLAEAWLKPVVKNRFTHVIIQVGGSNLCESQELARHAQDHGASAVAALSSVYNKPSSLNDLVTYCKMVAECAPDTPFFYYHFPAMSGVNFNMVDFFILAQPKIPTLRGLKFSCKEFDEAMGVAMLEDGRYQVLSGPDGMVLSAIVQLGGTAFVGSTFNYMPKHFHNVIKAVADGDLAAARAHQYKAVEIQECVSHFKNVNPIATMKAIMPMLGMDLGPTRPPIRNLDENKKEKLKKELDDVGFFGTKEEKEKES